jgi:hypothetical protein
LAVLWETTIDWRYNAGLAISSGIAPPAAVAVCRKFLRIEPDLTGLGPANIVVLSLGVAATNALLFNGYLYAIGRLHLGVGQIVTVFVGDVLGTAIVLLVLSGLLTFALPKRR